MYKQVQKKRIVEFNTCSVTGVVNKRNNIIQVDDDGSDRDLFLDMSY